MILHQRFMVICRKNPTLTHLEFLVEGSFILLKIKPKSTLDDINMK